jgi:cytochrome b561
MALKSTADHYGTMAVSIHWLSAVLILILMVPGFAPPAQGFDRKPHPVAGSPHWQERAAHAVHVLFYVVVFGMVASGVGMTVLSGAAPMILGRESSLLPDFWKYPPRLPHGIGARLLLALLVLHAGAALHHHFVRRDGLLWRMWFGNSSAAPPKRNDRILTDINDERRQ